MESHGYIRDTPVTELKGINLKKSGENMKKSGENMKKSGENMKKSGEIGTKSSTGNEGKREKRLKFLKKKKEFYQKKLDNACKNDPFLSHYRDGIRAYEEELSVEYAQMRRFE